MDATFPATFLIEVGGLGAVGLGVCLALVTD